MAEPAEVLDAGTSDAVFADSPQAGAPAPEQGSPGEPQQTGEVQQADQSEQGEALLDPALANTPFKSVAAAVDGYKNLQRYTAGLQRELQARQRELDEVKNTVREIAQRMQSQAQAPAQPTPEEFFQKFTSDPYSTLDAQVNARVERLLNERLSKLEPQVQAVNTDREIDAFLRQNPNLTAEEEQQLVQVLDADPDIKNLPPGKRLPAAYAIVFRMNAMRQQQQAQSGKAVADAKAAAGLGGKTSALKGAAAGGDEFDAVLDNYRATRELFGRKR